MRVAIVGAGVTGAACTWQLMQAVEQPLSLTLFDMGRGPGGRTATRRSRDAPSLVLNHGAPSFHVRMDTEAAPLVAALRAAGHIVDFSGTAGCLDALTGTSRPGKASYGEPPAEQARVGRYVGTPEMSSLAHGILKLAGVSAEDIRTSTKVTLIRPRSGGAEAGWELFDKAGHSLGEFDWVVITSASSTLTWWAEIIGEKAPVQIAASLAKSVQITELVKSLESVRFAPVHVAMLAWKAPDDDSKEASVAESLEALPFDITWVVGDAVLARVVRQGLGPPYAAVVLHSTTAFAEQHAHIFGSRSAASRMRPETGSSESESEVAAALYRAFEKLLLGHLGAKALSAPTWGPVLHRWGGAFPEGKHLSEGTHFSKAPVAQVIPQVQVAIAGDFLAPPYATVESAMRSGLAAAQGILNPCGQPLLSATIES